MRGWWLSTILILLVVGPAYPGETDWRNEIRAAEQLQAAGRLAEAEELLLKCARTPGEVSPGIRALLHNNLGSVTQDQGRFAQAEKHYRKSISIWEEDGESGRLGRARTQNNLASLLWFVGRTSEAARALSESAQTHIEILGADHPETNVVYSNLGTLLLSKGQWREAEAAFLNALKTMREKDGNTSIAAWLHYGMGVVYRSTSRAEQAAQSFRSAQAIWESLRSGGNLPLRHQMHLAVSYRLTGDTARFERLAKDTLTAALNDGKMSFSERVYLLSACSGELKLIPGMQKEARDLEKWTRRLIESDPQLRMSRETIPINALVDEATPRSKRP